MMNHRETEELVVKARLEHIAKEHRSMGAILDSRKLYALEEIKPIKRNIRVDAEKRLQGRRGGKSENDIKNKVHLAVEAFKEQGVNVEMLTGNFELEEKLWKNKASKRTYDERRKFQYPELEEFLQNMSPSQQLDYQDRVSQRLTKVVERLRRECAKDKAEMDMLGIFHPVANIQRIHCLYLIRLEKNINAQNIEDPVLKQMYKEAHERQLQELQNQIKKRQMLKAIEDEEKEKSSKQVFAGAAKNVSERPSSENNLLSMMDIENQKEEISLIDEDKLMKQIVTLKPFEEKVVEKRDLARSKWLPRIPIQKSKSAVDVCSIQKRNRSQLSNIVSTNKKIDVKENDEDMKVDNGLRQNRDSPGKIFGKKSKFDRLGMVESRSILSEEATKLDAAPSHVSRKSFDKNDLLDESLSKWMLDELQKTEIMKAASGGITSSAVSIATNLIDEVPFIQANTGNFSPKKILPFDEFYSILKGASDETSRLSSGSPSFPKNCRGSSVDEVFSTPRDRIDSVHLEPINIVKHLIEKDKHFDAFLKMNEREQPSSKLLEKLNASALKPRKQRKLPQLGKEAVTLSDSRGRPSKLANRGFTNVFLPTQAEDKDSIEAKIGAVAPIRHKEFDESEGIVDRLLNDHGVVDKNDSSLALNGAMMEDSLFPVHSNRSRSTNSDLKINSQEARKFAQCRLEDCMDDSMFILAENQEIDMQHKLLATWETLSVTMHERLAFMDKYSSSAYAAEMSRAVDMWAEVAVYVVVLAEALAFRKKLEAKLIIFPMNASNIIKQLIRKIHPLLIASVPCFIPPAILYDAPAQTVPLSVAAVVSVRDSVLSTISARNFSQNAECTDSTAVRCLDDAEIIFNEFIQSISKDLIGSLKRCHTELEDVIPFGNVTCKDWLVSLEILNRSHIAR